MVTIFRAPALKLPLKLRPAPVPGLQVHLEHLPALVPALSWTLRGVRPKILNIFENIQNILQYFDVWIIPYTSLDHENHFRPLKHLKSLSLS